MTTSTVSSHSGVEDRQTIGERARENTPISSQAGLGAGGRAARPCRAADRAERHPGGRIWCR